MNTSKKGWITASLLTIVLGAAWLLNIYHVVPSVDWIWTSLIGVIGVLTILLGGINKMTLVVGPFMLIASVFSILRQTGRITGDIEVPTLVIILGALMLLVTITPIPAPHWLNEADDNADKDEQP